MIGKVEKGTHCDVITRFGKLKFVVQASSIDWESRALSGICFLYERRD